MTDQKAKERRQRREDCIECILDLALALALERLEIVDPKEKKDNMAFDRVARTAQVLVRVADDADCLAARKRKENKDNEQSGDVADEDARIERDAAVLRRQLDKYIDGFAGGDAARNGGGDGAGRGAGGGNGS